MSLTFFSFEQNISSDMGFTATIKIVTLVILNFKNTTIWSKDEMMIYDQ